MAKFAPLATATETPNTNELPIFETSPITRSANFRRLRAIAVLMGVARFYLSLTPGVPLAKSKELAPRHINNHAIHIITLVDQCIFRTKRIFFYYVHAIDSRLLARPITKKNRAIYTNVLRHPPEVAR